MNQILHNKIKYTKKGIYFLKFQFYFSILLIILTILVYLINRQIMNSKEYTSQKIANNYNILKLYNNSNNSNLININQNGYSFSIIGMIEIPKINIYYPIISEANDELLKIAPCRISGPMPNEDGNLCIAGHNYDNYKFFSKLSNLNKNDIIMIYNINGQKSDYKIYDIYEVISNDLSPLKDSEKAKKQITLITCNNFNSSSRIIIKAISI